MNPLVTVVIPVYNGANFLSNAIVSAIEQTYQSVEILVINDGSTDGGATREVCQSFGTKVRYIEKQNGGVSSALNLALKEMKGEYFCWLSHDDEFLPDKIYEQINFAMNNNALLVYSDYYFIDASGMRLAIETDVAKVAGENIFLQLLKYYPINGCATLIHKSVFEKTGLFNETLPSTQDYDFWFRCAQSVPFSFFNRTVLRSRLHDAQDSANMPLRKYECDELYTRIARFVLTNQNLSGISQKQFFDCCKSLLKRRYFSSCIMLSNKITHFPYRMILLCNLFLYIGLSAVKGLLNARTK